MITNIIQFITIICSLFFVNMVTAQNDSLFVSEELKGKIIRSMNTAIYGYKARLCPEVDYSELIDSSNYPFINIGYGADLLYPDLERDFQYDYKIEPWSDNGFNHYINFFLVTKTSNVLTRTRLSTYVEEPEKYIRAHRDQNDNPIWITDSFTTEIPCYKYFPYDERFILYYDTVSRDFYFFSGNVNQDKLAYKFKDKSYYTSHYISVIAVLLRTAQYCTAKTSIRRSTDAEGYYEFTAKNTLFPAEKVLIRIPKTKHEWDFGDTWEIIYYSNRKDIPGNDEQLWYEVKYKRSVRPKSYHELFPIYTKLTWEQSNLVLRKFAAFIDYEPYPIDEYEDEPDE